MRNRTSINLITLFIIGFVVFTSCAKDNEDAPLYTSTLFDTWWYASNAYSPDFFFNTNVQFEQKAMLINSEQTEYGTWSWENESSGIMKIELIDDPSESYFWFKITDIRESSISIQQSSDQVEYTSKFYYQKTQN